MQLPLLSFLTISVLVLTGCQMKYHYTHDANIRILNDKLCIFANDGDVRANDYIAFYSVAEVINKKYTDVVSYKSVDLPVMKYCVPYTDFKKNVTYDVSFKVRDADTEQYVRYSSFFILKDHGEVVYPDDQNR
ncbi:TPA: hypothetical protein MYP81_001499 [Citrobacter farmeri]|nr:hypothetical protein Cf24236_0054 [Citrobacter farmeri]HAT3755401.1 hypothetical protein [Citrobacter amalonaticus]HCB1596461.1 hypothetical protein [Citrobacter farmeri]HCB1656626.1 hypothetical protein [Citrobacter farmeri]HCB1658188.1 hypothetical protein [Citrobacter farmeri]